MKLEHAALLVDRYLRGVAPDADALVKTFGIPLSVTLPLSAELRLNAKNQATTLYDLASRDGLSLGLKKVGEQLARHSPATQASSASPGKWFNRLLGAK